MQVLEEMQNQGHRPDVAMYNIGIGSLLQSGVESASRQAVQLFYIATRQGHFRLAFLSPLTSCLSD